MKKLLAALLILVTCFGCSSNNEIPKQEEKQPEKAEVVVIGGGAAGISAAIHLAEKGHQVVLLEKQSFLGGASMMASSGINAGSSSLQMETESPYTDDMFFDYAKSWDYGYDRIGYRVVPVREDFAYTFAYRSKEAADWIGSLGVEMKASKDSHSLQLASVENGKYGAVYISALKTRLEELSLIEVRLENRATEFILDENQAIMGVKVLGQEGEYEILTKAVLLASGGYASADSAFFQKYAPEWDGYTSTGAAGATGDGIVLADAVGAQLLGMEAITCTTVTIGEANRAGALAVNASLKNGAILLNQEGSRFVNETLGTAALMEAIKAQTNHAAFLLADDSVLKKSSDLAQAYENGLLQEAESLEELAKQLSLDSQAVLDAIIKYQEDAVEGIDEFEKDSFASDFSTGKYYGAFVQPAKRITTGGIVVNGNAEVLNTKDEVIQGLFAAGEVTAYGAHPLSAATIFGIQAADSIHALISE